MPTKKDEEDLEWSKLKKIIRKIPLNFLNQENVYTTASHFFENLENKILKTKIPTFFCHCNIERTLKMLKMLGENEIKRLISSEKKIEVTCEFCNKLFSFDEETCYRLFN